MNGGNASDGMPRFLVACRGTVRQLVCAQDELTAWRELSGPLDLLSILATPRWAPYNFS